jgi:nucleoside diphosphate kinase
MKHPKEEVTYVMMKPDGVKKGLIGEVIKRFEQRDLKIVALEMFVPEFDKVNDHYPKSEEWITRLGNKTLTTYEKYGYDAMKDFGTTDAAKIGPEIRKWLIDYMTSAPLVKMVVKGVHAVDVVRKVADVIQKELKNRSYGYDVIAEFDNSDSVSAQLEELLRTSWIDEIMQVNPKATDEQNLRLVEFARNRGIQFSFVPNLFDVQ